jgi:hypothetical protein
MPLVLEKGYFGVSWPDGSGADGFLLVLEWFENFRLRSVLPAGREAARTFWAMRKEMRKGTGHLSPCDDLDVGFQVPVTRRNPSRL